MKRTLCTLATVVLLAACGVGATVDRTAAADDAIVTTLQPTDHDPGNAPSSTDQPTAMTPPDQDAVGTPETESPSKPTPTSTPENGPPSNLSPPVTSSSLVEAAMQDLANRLSVEVSTITLIEASEVTWPNSSVGCPQPNMSYLQVLTPGSLIKLESGGVTYEYHAGPSGPPFYCATPTPPSEGGGGTGDY
jgi:hypothetical protein